MPDGGGACTWTSPREFVIVCTRLLVLTVVLVRLLFMKAKALCNAGQAETVARS